MTLQRLRLSASTLLLAAAALSLAPATLAQNPDRPPDQLRTLSRQELDIVKVLTQQERDWNRGDLDAFATGYKNSPDILFVGRQVSRGYAGMLADYKGNYPNKDTMGTLTFADLQPQVLDERFATVVGHYRLDRSKKAGGPAEGIFSLVFEKTDKGWKIILDHTT